MTSIHRADDERWTYECRCRKCGELVQHTIGRKDSDERACHRRYLEMVTEVTWLPCGVCLSLTVQDPVAFESDWSWEEERARHES